MGLEESSRTFFGRHSVNVTDWSFSRAVIALGIHEGLGLTLLAGFWLGCYRYQPMKRILWVAPKFVQTSYSSGLHWSREKMRKLPRGITERTDATRLLVSGAESFVLRKLLSPITVPSKIFIAVLLSGFVDV